MKWSMNLPHYDMRAVINSRPLVALTLSGQLDLLPILFSEFWIPEAVYQEVAIAGL